VETSARGRCSGGFKYGDQKKCKQQRRRRRGQLTQAGNGQEQYQEFI